MIAFCWANGQIGFGRRAPEGAIGFAAGPAKPLRQAIAATARLAYDGETLLVPGVPEAPDQNAGVDALVLHQCWLALTPRRHVEILIRLTPAQCRRRIAVARRAMTQAAAA